MTNTTIHLGADHRGFAHKERLKIWLEQLGCHVVDHGSLVLDPHDDFPEYAFDVAEHVVAENQVGTARGILLCGSGVGVTIAANKVKGARASLGLSPEMVRKGRADDDLNVLVIAADFQDVEQAKALITAFLDTPLDTSDRRLRRLEQIQRYEQHA